MSNKSYNDSKSSFFNNAMKGGATRNQANNSWRNSDARQEAETGRHSSSYLAGHPNADNGVNIDRSYGSTMQDWAEDSDDL